MTQECCCACGAHRRVDEERLVAWLLRVRERVLRPARKRRSAGSRRPPAEAEEAEASHAASRFPGPRRAADSGAASRRPEEIASPTAPWCCCARSGLAHREISEALGIPGTVRVISTADGCGYVNDCARLYDMHEHYAATRPSSPRALPDGALTPETRRACAPTCSSAPPAPASWSLARRIQGSSARSPYRRCCRRAAEVLALAVAAGAARSGGGHAGMTVGGALFSSRPASAPPRRRPEHRDVARATARRALPRLHRQGQPHAASTCATVSAAAERSFPRCVLRSSSAFLLVLLRRARPGRAGCGRRALPFGS